MPMDEAMLAEVRQANAAYLAGYERRLAAEIVAMLPEAPRRGRAKCWRSSTPCLELPAQPPASEPQPDAA